MNHFFTVSLILLMLCGVFNITRQLQMLQQNSYFPSRYTKWLKTNIPFFQFLLYFTVSVLWCAGLYTLQAAVCSAALIFSVYHCLKNQKESIKKLVFTGRVKRQFASAAAVYIILFILYIAAGGALRGKICAAALILVCTVTPITVYICYAVTLPVEKMFAAYFINDAKRILKSYKELKVIGITGSYGKTTTKFILTRILSEKYNTVCTPQSFNTPMGIVRTVRENLKPQTQVFVCEMGAKNSGDIKEICDIVDPDYGIITSVGPQHLETFKTVDNIFKTKFELADAVVDKGKVFVNGDSAEIKDRVQGKGFSVYGTDPDDDACAENISYTRYGCEFDLKLGKEKVHLTSKLLGLHSIINITGAAALAYSLGVSAEEIRFAVASLKPAEHRLEIKKSYNGSLLIDDAYNANPEGCLEAVRVLGSFDGMKKVIITPVLVELGDREYDCNFDLGLETARECDIIIFVGEKRSKPMTDAVKTTDFDIANMFVAASFREAMEIYSRFADSNTVLLIENDLPDNYLY